MIVGCAVIIQKNQILLLKKAYGYFKDKYEFPGGKLHENETIQECIIREVKEEINCDCKINKFLCTDIIQKEEINIKEDITLYFYQVQINDFSNIKLSNEHTEFIWTPINNAKNLNIIKWDYKIFQFLEQNF